MSVHKPKFKNITIEKIDRIVKHHLPYELWMMRESLSTARKGSPTWFRHNSHVEGLALHCRNLIEFLKNGDACAFNPADFTADTFKVNKKFIRPTLIDKINEQISHLTDDRTEDREEKFKPDDWTETVEAIEAEFARWVENLTAEWAKKWQERERIGESAPETMSVERSAKGACTAPTAVGGSSDDK
jgi:hypothetical protein